MRLDNTPPKGAGKSHGVKKTDLLLAHIEGLGTDKVTGNPIGIRVAALAHATGVGATSIPTLLSPYVASGRLQCCKVTRPGLPPMNEYRKGIGVAMPDFVPLKTKRGPGSLVVARNGAATPAAAPLSTPRAAVATISTPQFLNKPQPAVGKADTTPAADDAVTTPPVESAVAAPATPKSTAGAALKKEPATRKASAGDDLRIGINCDGVIVIASGAESIELNQKQARKLGYFMAGTAGVWNPF